MKSIIKIKSFCNCHLKITQSTRSLSVLCETLLIFKMSAPCLSVNEAVKEAPAARKPWALPAHSQAMFLSIADAFTSLYDLQHSSVQLPALPEGSREECTPLVSRRTELGLLTF